MTRKQQLENKIKIREDMNKKWGGNVYSQQEILNLKQELKKLQEGK
jgi:uncharacterized protein YydD (DUF2326 family)